MSVSDTRRRDWVDTRISKKQKLILSAEEKLEAKLGIDLFTDGEKRLGWLLTLASSSWEDQDTHKEYSCVDLYFVCQDGTGFKAKYKFRPYFYVATKEKMEMDVDAYLRRRYEGQIADIEIQEKEDLDLKNHLSGLRKCYLKISFDTVQQLMQVKKDLVHIVERNQVKLDAEEAYESILTGKSNQQLQDFIDCIVDLREFDVPYHVRFSIDNDVRCGQWYDVSVSATGIILEKRMDLLQRAEVRVCAFDIETTKLPLKFPDAEYDSIMMISYMVDGKGYLLINRECVGEDIEDLEYTPKPEYEGYFKVTNVKNEKEILSCWFEHMQYIKPGIYASYNGDFFDWPFLESRAAHHGYNLKDELGFRCDKNQGECRAKFACHLDCFAWVKRDSYLPQGSHGLKAVTKAKLGYDPLEVNPEDMVRFAKEKPQMMASYSVSDAVATYYLYMTYVHPFIFSLATIIPMPPDEVLRKGSGTLCEMLLMVQAYKANVICPNKHQSDPEKFYNNKLLESETYIGGHVECLESGVFRSDLPTSFKLDPSAFETLIENLDRDLQYAIRVEGKFDIEKVINYNEVKNAIKEKLLNLRDGPTREECPLIYHLDVAAMYPNIILTNRLQPPSIVTDEICTACDFNRPGKQCLRKLEWVWRGETYMAKRSDYYHLKTQVESELSYSGLSKADQELKLKDRLKKYCQKAYKRVLNKPVMELREAGICMRENPFYVDTVRSFRDRRYEYKGLNKVWKGKLSEAKASGNSMKIQEAQDMVVLYDSLQLAHKCILNSFYGYVMRKGARWYSMEMAGVVTYTGAKIIQNARLLIERIGKPLELDTDGIWCALPGSFPENFTFTTRDLKKFTISYPCVMLNVDVAQNNTNDQYQTLEDPQSKTYKTHSECSIEFEVDGPYKAMILPASKEEGILIKKRYAVFNDDGTLAELKGFEIKRRGELKLIKVFQAELFDKFLYGSTLQECYASVAAVANRWLDFLDSQGSDIADSELLDYISESSTMSKSLVEYGEQKSCAVTTAKRLADFLGDAMVRNKGLLCQYVVACEPKGTPVSERAIPVAIFETEPEIMKFYVRKWCKVSSEVGIRSIIDWSYYRQRLGSAIQKIITIPAAMQKIMNPVPRVLHPDWLHKKVREKEDKYRQRKLVDVFNSHQRDDTVRADQHPEKNTDTMDEHIRDIEDFMPEKNYSLKPQPAHNRHIHNDLEMTNMKEILHKGKEGNGDKHSAPCLQKVFEGNIDQKSNYHGWLEFKKRKWKEDREKRKRQRLDNSRTLKVISGSESPIGAANLRRHRRVAGVGSYFQQQDLALTHYHWQIIQLVPAQQPGQLSAWVVVNGIMHKVPIIVARKFYLNSKAPVTEDFPGRHVNKSLPHGHKSYNLIEVTIDEDQFRDESQRLLAHLADPDVEGIYETKIPLELNAILQIGCVCKVDHTAKKKSFRDGWSLSDLNMKTTTECPYLEKSICFFYLYHSISDSRAIYIGYFPASSQIYVVVVNPFQTKELSVPMLERQFREVSQASSCPTPAVNEGIAFKMDYVSDIKDAERILQMTLAEYRHKHQRPILAVVECPNFQLMKSTVPALEDFPCVTIPSNLRDSQYQAIGWQVIAAKIGLQRCAASSQWLNERVALSRYAHVPLGNFEVDWLIYTLDVFLSRALRDNQQLLWISDNGIPDLGGTNAEATCFIDEVNQPCLTNPGAYRKITVELKIHHLAVNALLKSNQVNEMEGGSVFGLDPKLDPDFYCSEKEYSFDEATSCAPAFRVLKQLVQRCLADAVTSGNVFADAILQHLYRWLCSPKSRLHDPALHCMLHKIMKKVFALLLAEIRKMGGTIIFASFKKIIFDTGKLDLSAAKVFCESVLKTLQTRDLFEWIDLEPIQFWDCLLFMDQYNYGGIQARMEVAEDSSEVRPEIIFKNDPDIVSSWAIAEMLPKVTQDHFIVIVSEFLFFPWKYAQDEAAKRESALGNACTPSITASTAEAIESVITEFLRKKIASDFTEKLLKIVCDIETRNKPHDGSSQSSSKIHKANLALDFIKYVCAVLALDKKVQHEVLVMRRNLLKSVHVREFAPEAEFQHLSMSLILPNVICSYCNDCRDMDLGRDKALTIQQEWHCAVPQCLQPYDREVMENVLIQITRQKERLYQLQDLKCVKCNQIKASRLAEHCNCGGSFACTVDSSKFRKEMQILLDAAVAQKFQFLQELVTWIIQRC